MAPTLQKNRRRNRYNGYLNMKIAYAPLDKQFDFDADRIKEEIELLIKGHAQERTLPFENGRSVYDQQGLLKIASEEELNNTSKYYINDQGHRVLVPGKMKTYHVFNLTFLPEEPDSLIDIYRHDDPDKKIFWHVHKKPFTWRSELEGTYIQQVVNQFPWEYVQGVRLIYMSPPSLGQIHKDSQFRINYRYFNEGFASISLNVDSGGGVLNYLDHSGKQCFVDNSVKIFHFDDSMAHGVTPITSDRYQIRIWGKLKVPYESILDLH